MTTQKLSFDGLEVQPDLEVKRVNFKKGKKRRYTDGLPADAAASSASASSPSSTAAASSTHALAPRAKRPRPQDGAKDGKKAKTPEQRQAAKEFKEKLHKYEAVQGPLFTKAEIKKVTNSKLKKQMKEQDKTRIIGAQSAARAEVLLPSDPGSLSVTNGMDRTWRISQDQLAASVDARTQNKMFDLKLDKYGPYQATYTRNGRHMLLTGRKGHLSLMNWHTFDLESELHVSEQVEDACFLHNETMWAVAQKKYVYIYDRTGMELHCLRNHNDVTRLDFLPYHFLLVSIGRAGYLKYQDTSTGQFLCEHRTKLGACNVMSQNPHNAVMCLGHTNGTVTMWTPNMSTPVVSMFAHKAPLLALGVDLGGHMMATSGLDGQVKIFDVRTYKELYSYFTVRPASTLDVSDTGLLALGYGPHVQVWKDVFRTKQNAPYMYKQLSGNVVKSVAFCPLEDVLGVGHSGGFSSLVIPGAGHSNFDSFEANPFETRKQRRETTVHALLDRLQPDMITLDANMFGLMNKKSEAIYAQQRKEMREKKVEEQTEKSMQANKMRGRSKSSKKAARKRANIIDAARMERAENAAKVQQEIVKRKEEAERKQAGLPKNALQRFAKK